MESSSVLTIERPIERPSSATISNVSVSSDQMDADVANVTEQIVSQMTDSIVDENESESPKKKLKSETESVKQKLEHRLGGILCCAVCLDLPNAAVFQCSNGHLMCVGCFAHLLADARLRDESATCPNCRCSITKDCSRNLAVEKAVCELPGLCRHCNSELPRALLDKHQQDYCEERIVGCKYANIGCQWRGPNHESATHAESCSHPSKSGREVLDFLLINEKWQMAEKMLYDSIFELLSFEKITFRDSQLKPYRTDEYIHKLYYETTKFDAFDGLQFAVKARVNDDQRDPTQSCERQLTYQLVLKNKLKAPFTLHYLILKGPYGDMKVHPRLYKHEFTESSTESPFTPLPLYDSAECNKLLSAKVINIRLVMFQTTK